MEHQQYTLEEVIARVGSRFAVVVAAAKRAKQIKDGSPPLVTVKSRNPLTIAMAEISAGKVIILPPDANGEEITIITADQYYAGRDRSADEPIIFRSTRRVTDDVDDDLDDDDFDDDFDDDDDDDEDE